MARFGESTQPNLPSRQRFGTPQQKITRRTPSVAQGRRFGVGKERVRKRIEAQKEERLRKQREREAELRKQKEAELQKQREELEAKRALLASELAKLQRNYEWQIQPYMKNLPPDVYQALIQRASVEQSANYSQTVKSIQLDKAQTEFDTGLINKQEFEKRYEEITGIKPVFQETQTKSTSEFTGVVQPIPEPKNIFEAIERSIQSTRSERFAKAKGDLGLKENIIGFGLGASANIFNTASTYTEFIKDPVQTTKDIFSGGKALLTDDVAQANLQIQIGKSFQEPGFTSGVIASEVAIDIATGKVISKASDLGSIGKAKLTGNLAPTTKLDDVTTAIKVTPTTSTTARASDNVLPFKIVNQIDTADNIKTIELLSEGKGFGVPIQTQVSLAGKKVDAVSASTGFLSNIDDTKVILKQGQGLERSLFADPFGRARTSRLGLEQPSASLSDVLFGDVTLTRTKPQLLVFFDTPVERFPLELRGVVKKLRAGQTLTPAEQNRLLQFQLTPSGKFKPLGFVSSEAEITLAPGEIATKKGVLGIAEIKGRPVQILELGIGEASPELKKLQLAKLTGSISQDDLKRLGVLTAKESGISSPKIDTPFLQTSGGLSSLSSLRQESNRGSVIPISSPTSSSSVVSPISPSSLVSKPKVSRVSSVPQLSSSSAISSPSSASPISSPKASSGISGLYRQNRAGITPAITPKPTLKIFDSKQPKQQRGSFLVSVRRGGIFKAIGRRSTLGSAFSLGKRRTDTGLGATFNIRKLQGGVLGGSLLPGKKFKRKRVRGIGGLSFVEGAEFRLDTPGEVLGIQRARKRKKRK